MAQCVGVHGQILLGFHLNTAGHGLHLLQLAICLGTGTAKSVGSFHHAGSIQVKACFFSGDLNFLSIHGNDHSIGAVFVVKRILQMDNSIFFTHTTKSDAQNRYIIHDETRGDIAEEIQICAECTDT